MVRVWNRGKYFLIPWAIFVAGGALAVFGMGKQELHLALNTRQPEAADAFFRFLTRLGEGWALAGVLFYLFFKARPTVLFLLSSWLSTVLLIQLLKQTVFSYMRRPAAVFEGSDAIHFVEGVTYRFSHSFPSGHTGDIFSLCFAMALLAGKPKYGILFFLPALAVGYSRVFLSQHFMQDIVAGAFLAVCCTSLCFWLWYKKSAAFRRYIDPPVL